MRKNDTQDIAKELLNTFNGLMDTIQSLLMILKVCKADDINAIPLVDMINVNEHYDDGDYDKGIKSIDEKLYHYTNLLDITKAETVEAVIDEVTDVVEYFQIDKRVILFSILDAYAFGEPALVEKVDFAGKIVDNINRLRVEYDNSKNDVTQKYKKEFQNRLNKISNIVPNKLEESIISGNFDEIRNVIQSDNTLKSMQYSDVEIMGIRYFFISMLESKSKVLETDYAETGKRLFLLQGNKNNIAEQYLLKAIYNGDFSLFNYLMELYIIENKLDTAKKLYLAWQEDLSDNRQAKKAYINAVLKSPNENLDKDIIEYYVESVDFLSNQPEKLRENIECTIKDAKVLDKLKSFIEVFKEQNKVLRVPFYESILLYDHKLRGFVNDTKFLYKRGFNQSTVKRMQSIYDKFDFNRGTDLKNTIERVISFIGLNDNVAMTLYRLLLAAGTICEVNKEQSATFNFFVDLFKKDHSANENWPILNKKIDATLTANLIEDYKNNKDVESISEFILKNYESFISWYDEDEVHKILTGNGRFTKADKEIILLAARKSNVYGLEKYYSEPGQSRYNNDAWIRDVRKNIAKENKLHNVLTKIKVDEDNLDIIFREIGSNEICLSSKIRSWLKEASYSIGMNARILEVYHSMQSKMSVSTDRVQYLCQLYIDALKGNYFPESYEESVVQFCKKMSKNRYAFVCLCYLYAQNGNKQLSDTICYLLCNDQERCTFTQDLNDELYALNKEDKDFLEIFIGVVEHESIEDVEEHISNIRKLFIEYPNKKVDLDKKFEKILLIEANRGNDTNSLSQSDIFELLCYKYDSEDVNLIWDRIKGFVLALSNDAKKALAILIIKHDLKNLKRGDRLHSVSSKFIEDGAFCKILKDYKSIRVLKEDYKRYEDGFNLISKAVIDPKNRESMIYICSVLSRINKIYDDGQEGLWATDNIKSNVDNLLNEFKNNNNDWQDVKKHLELLLQNECDVLSRQPRLEVNIFDSNRVLVVDGKAYIYGAVRNKGNCVARNLVLRAELNNDELIQQYTMIELKPDNVGYFEIVCNGVEEAPYNFAGRITYDFENQKSFNDFEFDIQLVKSTDGFVEGEDYSTQPVTFKCNKNGTDVYSENFYGRKTETRKLRSLVKGEDFCNYRSAIIFGERRTGKTTLLSYLNKYIKCCCQNAISIKVDAQSRNTIQDVFVIQVLKSIKFEYVENKVLNVDVKAWEQLLSKWEKNDESDKDINLQELKEFYIELFNVTKMGLVLLIDEFDSLLKKLSETSSKISIDALFTTIISMIEDEGCREVIHFVFCGSNELEHISNTGSNRQQLFQKLGENKLQVGVLTQEDINNLLKSNKEWKYTQESLDMMWHYTEGAVFYVKLLANKVIEFAGKRKRNKIYPYDVTDNISKILNDTNFNQFKEWYYGDESNHETLVVNAIQLKSNEKGKYVSLDEINNMIISAERINNIDLESSIRKLMNYHIIEKHKDSKKYRFEMELCRQYFRTMDSDGVKEPDLEPKFEVREEYMVAVNNDEIVDSYF